MPGAGHGSTMRDKAQNLWHTATMRISKNHQFERRVGLWKAGFDADGELFCNQNYETGRSWWKTEQTDPWSEPEWVPFELRKTGGASSFVDGKEPEKAFDENVQTWWRAEGKQGEWLET